MCWTTAAGAERRGEVKPATGKAVARPDGLNLTGTTPASGALDLARAVTRRAERRCLTLERGGGFENPQARRWLNRLSLLLFVLARYEEGLSGRESKAAKPRARHSG